MKPRVLFVASVYVHIKNFHMPYIKEFKARGWEVDLACNACMGQDAGADNYIDLPFEKSFFSLRNFEASRVLREQFTHKKYDLVVCHTSLAAFFTRFALLRMKVRAPLCNMVHGYLFDDKTHWIKRAILFFAEKVTAPVTDLVITMNEFDTEFAKKHRFGKRVACVNGVGLDTSKLLVDGCKSKIEARTELGLDQSAKVLLYAAEFSKRKNQGLIIKAMQMMPENVILALPGQGALLDECKSLAQRLGLADRIVFPGYVNQMAVWFAAADVAVSSSRSEGLPFNLLEAMYQGLPIVASEVKGHMDLIEDGVNGYLYPYGNCAEFASKVQELLSAPELMAEFGANSRIRVKKYYLENVLPTIVELYESVTK